MTTHRSKRPLPEYVETPLPLTQSVLRVGMVQIPDRSSRENDKVLIGNRETYAWKNLQAIAERKVMLKAVLDHLGRTEGEPLHLVVFPEYCLPVDHCLEELQAFSDRCGTVIVASADNTLPDHEGRVLTRCPVIIPKKPPVWVEKRHLSKWELPYVDPSNSINIPLFTWNDGPVQYGMVVSLCSEFLHAIREADALPEYPVLYAVPMCSPKLSEFHAYADTIIGQERSAAVLLCNACGEFASGMSSVFAITPAGAPMDPALDLPAKRAQIVEFVLDCALLHPRKRQGEQPASCITDSRRFDIVQADPNSLKALPTVIRPIVKAIDETPIHRAIVNPYVYDVLNLKLRMTWLDIAGYGKISDIDIRHHGMECYAVLGHHDIMITHLRSSSADLYFAIQHALPAAVQQLPYAAGADPAKSLPYFEVDRYHKVLGEEIPIDAASAFVEQVPSPEQIEVIAKLAANYHGSNVPQSIRDEYLRRKWILGTTGRQPGAIRAAMTVYINHPDGIGPLQLRYEEDVLPWLRAHSAVTSIFEGTGHKMQAHYVLRVNAAVDELFKIVDELHRRCADAHMIISTSTYVMMKEMSPLDIERALLTEQLVGNEAERFAKAVLGHLPPNRRAEAQKFSARAKRAALNVSARAGQYLEEIKSRPRQSGQVDRVRERFLWAVLSESFDDWADAYGMLHSQVEEIMRAWCDRLPSKDIKDRAKAQCNIPAHKDSNYTYSEHLRLARYAVQNDLVVAKPTRVIRSVGPTMDERMADREALVESIDKLIEKTVAPRNAVAHGDAKRGVTSDDFSSAMIAYLEFLAMWQTMER